MTYPPESGAQPGGAGRGAPAPPAPPGLLFSVILPTRDRLDPLRATLAALRAQTLPPGSFEIVVVDDGSVDGTAAFLAGEVAGGGLLVARTAGRGPAVARNAGLAQARGGLLAFTDDDCVAPPDWLERLAAMLGPGGADAVGGGVVNGLPGLLPGVYQDMAGFFYDAHNREPGRARFLTTNNFGCRRAALEQAGPFEERFRMGGSDRDMAHRMVERGLLVDYRPELVVTHYHHFGWGSFLRHLYRQGRGSFLFRVVLAAERHQVPPGLPPGGYLALLRRVARGHGVAGVGAALAGQAAVAAGYLAAALKLQKP